MSDKIGKRGQVTIWIIIVIIIVGVLLIIFLGPEIGLPGFVGGAVNPSSYLRDCVEPHVDDGIELLSKQGGYANPEGFLVYQNEKVKYLCYTDDFYETCVVQQPLLKRHFEMELKTILNEKVSVCYKNLVNEYDRKGYSVNSGSVDTSVEIVPGNIIVNINAPLTVTKETSQNFREFEISYASEMDDILAISTSIIDFESSLGDSQTSLYYQYYPNLRIDKIKLGDGSTVYTVSDVVTDESFTFASRSLAWPPGYGLDDL